MSRYDFQDAAVADATEFLRQAKPGERRLYQSPTGTGKSFMERRVQAGIPDSIIVTPRVEIGFDMCEKIGAPRTEAGMHGAGIWTPITLRNRMLAGEIAAPSALIIDEAHHHLADTYQTLDLLCGMCPAVGFTATPYRGTPKATSAFRKQWGEPVPVISIPEAIGAGVLSFPTLRVVPLVDDDKIEVKDGQFVVTAIESETGDKLADVAQIVRGYTRFGTFDRPSMISMPSRELARCMGRELAEISVHYEIVDGDTPRSYRETAFRACVERRAVLVQIQVVSEGVDLPIRRLFDLHPMISPVEFLQQFGRITRPVAEGEAPPEYVGFNRNLLRHAYLLEGCCPPQVYAAMEAAFGGPSKRAGMRAVGLECLGRFKGAEFPLLDGSTGLMYALSSFDPASATTQHYACLVNPLSPDPVWVCRVNERTDDPRKPHYGKWSRCDPPGDLAGFASMPPSPLTDKQKAWWVRSAKAHGLDPAAEVNRKSFSVLPILSDLRCKI